MNNEEHVSPPPPPPPCTDNQTAVDTDGDNVAVTATSLADIVAPGVRDATASSRGSSAAPSSPLLYRPQRMKASENVIVNNFVDFFGPLVESLDAHVESLRMSQCELTNQIKSLLNQIGVIYEDEKKKLDLDEYTKKLTQAKKRLNNVQVIIIAVQERLNRIYVSIQKDPHFRQYRENREKQQQQQNGAIVN